MSRCPTQRDDGGGADRGKLLKMALPYMRLSADEALDLHGALVRELGDATRALVGARS